MQSKFYTFSISAFIFLAFANMTYSQGTIEFEENFDTLTAGQQLACQDPTDWSTWSNLPCDPTEDAYISDTYAYSGTNSAVIVQDNDLIKALGTKTSGKWDIGFMVYIPEGKTGYINCLSQFFATPQEWAMHAWFDSSGSGALYAGSTTPISFTWVEDTWQLVRIVVDLDIDQAEFWFEQTLVYTWQWTLGQIGAGGPLQLDAVDFYGDIALVEMYVDDFLFGSYYVVPVELTSFTAVGNGKEVLLNWTTATELNNMGFEIQRNTEGNEFSTIGFVEGNGTTTDLQKYSFTDSKLINGKYFYRLKQLDFNGQFEYSDIIEIDWRAFNNYLLEQNYPNPFNPTTTIGYGIKDKGIIKISVYNSICEEVAILVNEEKESGFHEVEFNSTKLPSGIYFYKLETEKFIDLRKMILIK